MSSYGGLSEFCLAAISVLLNASRFSHVCTLLFGCIFSGSSSTHRGVYPRWPDECRRKQGRKTEEETQRAVDVSSHDEEHRGRQPVMAWIIIPLSDWKVELKSHRTGGDLPKSCGSAAMLNEHGFACRIDREVSNHLWNVLLIIYSSGNSRQSWIPSNSRIITFLSILKVQLRCNHQVSACVALTEALDTTWV